MNNYPKEHKTGFLKNIGLGLGTIAVGLVGRWLLEKKNRVKIYKAIEFAIDKKEELVEKKRMVSKDEKDEQEIENLLESEKNRSNGKNRRKTQT